MAKPTQSFLPEEQDTHQMEPRASNSRYTGPQEVYGPQQYIPDMGSWPDAFDNFNDQPLGEHTSTSFDDNNFDAQYHFEHDDLSLWQYDEEHLHLEDASSSVHPPPETIVIDPRLRSPQLQHNYVKNTMPHPVTDIHQGQYREQITPKPESRQPYSQMFVVPITNRGDKANPFPDSNGMFCDFPGIAFRSFLPEGAVGPISTSRKANEAFLGPDSSGRGKPVIVQGPTQPQVYTPFRTRGSMGSDSSANSTPYASSMSRFTTPDVA